MDFSYNLALLAFDASVSFLVFVSLVDSWKPQSEGSVSKITLRPQRPQAVFEDLEITGVEPCSELHATASSQFIWNFQLFSLQDSTISQ